MKEIRLFSNKIKMIAVVLCAVTVVAFIAVLIFFTKKQFITDYALVYNTLKGLLLISLALIAFSKEKAESEAFNKVRLISWTRAISFTVLICVADLLFEASYRTLYLGLVLMLLIYNLNFHFEKEPVQREIAEVN